MTGLYIHIPFCRKKCDYCDFASISIGSAADMIGKYLEAMKIEMDSVRADGRLPQQDISTIFIGGGTPTLLTEDQIIQICKDALQGVSAPETIEFSIEGNPDSITSEKLKIMKRSGVNRLSIGAQSFNDDELKTLGRIHNSKQIRTAFENTRNAGFDNINIDLIFGIPGQTFESWKRTLGTAIKLDPEHISCYGLQIEEGTPFFGKFGSGCKQKYGRNTVPPLPDDDTQFEMYKHTIDLLISRGYHHYEISNFTKPGYECKHNINYWKNGNYLGIGASAASHIGGRRWENTTNIDEYICKCGSRTASPNPPTTGGGGAPKTEITETILMNLRLLEGIDLTDFEKRFGAPIYSLYGTQIEDLISNGLLEVKNGQMRLTEKGLYLGNIVFESFV